MKGLKLLSIILLLSILICCDTQKEAEVVKQEEPKVVKQEEPEFIEISMATLVNDVINGGRFYEDKYIKIRGRVVEGSLTNTIETHRPNVFIYMSNIILGNYKVGESYTFKLHVWKIDYTHISARLTNWHIHTLIQYEKRE